jgi:peptidoglycan/xylan/chitin deacetylase (PgdA/CDA1 family)
MTFDDGYADNAGDARSILAAARLPATFFVTAGRVGQRGEVWWDRLEQILAGCRTSASAIEIDIGGRTLWADIRSPAARERAHLALFWRLRLMPPAMIDRVLDDVEDQLGVQSVAREAYRWMDVDELRALASSEGVDIGAHSLTHPFLATLGEADQWREIDGSRQSLEHLLGSRVAFFSYPYGGPGAFDEITTRLVRSAGYTIACTATGGIAHLQRDPLQVPRNVVGDWDADRFEGWLDHWLSAR